MMTKKQMNYLGLLLCWIYAFGLVAGMQVKVAAAATQASCCYGMTNVTISPSTIVYGDSSETFYAELSVPNGTTAPDPSTFYFRVDGQAYKNYGSIASQGAQGSGTQYSLTASLGNPFAVGTHSVIAEYSGAQTVDSAGATTLTVLQAKASTTISCTNNGGGPGDYAVPAGVTFGLGIQFSSSSVDWKNSTYTITFVGVQHTISETLPIDDYYEVHSVTPTDPDRYTVQCTFNGTSAYNPASTALPYHILIYGSGTIPGGTTQPTPGTTPPAGSAATPSVSATGVTTPTVTGTATATASSTATSTSGVAGTPTATTTLTLLSTITTHTDNGGGGSGWIWLIVLIIVIGGGLAGLLVWRKGNQGRSGIAPATPNLALKANVDIPGGETTSAAVVNEEKPFEAETAANPVVVPENGPTMTETAYPIILPDEKPPF